MRKAHRDGRFLRHSRARGNPVGPASVPVVHESPAGTPALLSVQVRGDNPVGVPIPANQTRNLAIAVTRILLDNLTISLPVRMRRAWALAMTP